MYEIVTDPTDPILSAASYCPQLGTETVALGFAVSALQKTLASAGVDTGRAEIEAGATRGVPSKPSLFFSIRRNMIAI
jgi:hypothetical protein